MYRSVYDVQPTSDHGGGPVYVEQKRFMSLSEIHTRLENMGYLADLKARSQNVENRQRLLQRKEMCESLCSDGSCPSRPSMVDRGDLVMNQRTVSTKIHEEKIRRLDESRKAAEREKELAFKRAVDEEVARRVSSNPKVVG